MKNIFFVLHIKTHWVTLVLLMFFAAAKAQPAEIASLRVKIAQQQQEKGYEQDTAYINSIVRLAYLHYALDDDTLFFYARKALDLSSNISYTKGMGESLRQIGNGFMFTGDFDQALSYYQQSLVLARKINDKRLICLALSNIGLNYSNIGKFDDALVYTRQAYQLAVELGDKLRIAGELDNLAEIFFAKKEYAQALEYARNALQMATSLKNYYYMAFLRNSLGNMLYSQGDLAGALANYNETLAYYNSTNDVLGITNTKLLIAKVYFKYKNYPLAIAYAAESLKIAKTKKGKKDIADAAQVLADIYEEKGDYKNALANVKTAKLYNDSLFNDQSQKKLFELQAKFKYEQQEKLLEQKQAQKDLLSANVLRNKKQQVVIAVLISISLGVVVVALYLSRLNKLRLNNVLQEKNIEILRQKEEIEIKAAQLRISNNQKDKLFSLIAHDLRTPLNSLQSLLTLFKDGALPPEQLTVILARLNVDVDQTVSLVTNLLYWASSQMKGIEIKPVLFLLKNCVADGLEGIEKTAAEKGIILEDKTEAGMQVFADKDMVQLVVRNLLSNAVKFCTGGDHITVSAEKKGDETEVCIADTGAGIAEDILQKINNGESVTTFGTLKEKGTGLGLVLCKDFIAHNNGVFRIESTKGTGSRFYFTLKNGA